MTSSFHGGIRKLSRVQSKFGSWMSALPDEFTTWLAYGFFRHRSVLPSGMTNWYSSPICTPGTSADQYPLPSLASGLAVGLHWLNVPAANTAGANGAQTRNAAPPGNRIVPMPGRADGCGTDIE